MGLPWVRLDTAFPRNPKILALLEEKDGYRAALVWVCSLAYSGEQGTDGFVPRYALQHLHGRPADAEKLVIHSLWVPVLTAPAKGKERVKSDGYPSVERLSSTSNRGYPQGLPASSGATGGASAARKAAAGWNINDWASFQQSTEETQERKAKTQLAGRKAACSRWHERGCTCWQDTG
jgi:hypothetical protein